MPGEGQEEDEEEEEEAEDEAPKVPPWQVADEGQRVVLKGRLGPLRPCLPAAGFEAASLPGRRGVPLSLGCLLGELLAWNSPQLPSVGLGDRLEAKPLSGWVCQAHEPGG